MNIPATAVTATGTHKNELTLFYPLLELAVIVVAGRIVVINVGLDLGVISPKLFTLLVIMAIFSTVITTPARRYYMSRAGLVPSGPVLSPDSSLRL